MINMLRWGFLFLFCTWEIVLYGADIYSLLVAIGHLRNCELPTQRPQQNSNTMASVISHVKDAAHTAHAHVAALLSHNQAKPGDKLPLNETVKETDATTPITLAPSGKNIFVRHICPAPPLPLLLFPSLSSLPLISLFSCARITLTISFFSHFLSNYEIGWRAWGFHAYVPLAGAGIHREVRRVQGEGDQRNSHRLRE